jgi:hypothetical protein
MMMKVKSNEALFNRWLQLGDMVALGKALVQNDIEISRDDLAAWAEEQFRVIGEYKKLVKESVDYVLEEDDKFSAGA